MENIHEEILRMERSDVSSSNAVRKENEYGTECPFSSMKQSIANNCKVEYLSQKDADGDDRMESCSFNVDIGNLKNEGLDRCDTSDQENTDDSDTSSEQNKTEDFSTENGSNFTKSPEQCEQINSANLSNKSDTEISKSNSTVSLETNNVPEQKQSDIDDLSKFGSWNVISETADSDGNGSEENSDDTDYNLSSDELDALLEEGLPDDYRKRKVRKRTEAEDTANGEEQPYEEKDKIVLIEKCHNHFDLLPEGWIRLTHFSGMPLYLHKTTRVCTLSKPYFLGSGSARKHKIPLGSIPCLSYRRALDQEEEEKEKARLEAESAKTDENAPAAPVGLVLPNPRIETAEEHLLSQSLTSNELREYCSKLFQFKTVNVMRFKSWSARRKHAKRHRQEKQLQRPTLPDSTKLITLPIQNSDANSGGNNHTQKEWIMNPNGKSHVCILHEYVQHVLKKQPSYHFQELENAATPYAATISISGMKYGVGYGASKKQAKSEAAKSTLEILIPQMKIITDEKNGGTTVGKSADQDLSFFDDIKIEDPRVAEFCAKTTEPSPHAILLTCLQRNFGLGDMRIEYQGNMLKRQKNQFTMTAGKHKATVVCKNKRDGKQRASQAILQALHPHITSWGSLLRLYGNRSVKSFQEKKQEEQEITQLQSRAAENSPNYAILDKLRTEMKKLKEKRDAIRPLGPFIPEEIPNVEISDSYLNHVDL